MCDSAKNNDKQEKNEWKTHKTHVTSLMSHCSEFSQDIGISLTVHPPSGVIPDMKTEKINFHLIHRNVRKKCEKYF